MTGAIIDFVRRSLGYKFPRLGRAAFSVFFKLAPRQIDTKLFPGIRVRLDLQDLTQRTTYWQGDRFEYPTALILSDWAARGAERFFDIGSNYGFFTYYMLSQHRGIKVHAFEPNPPTAAIIERVKSENRLENLHLNKIGLSDRPDTLVLHQGATDTGHSTFGEHPELKYGKSVSVPVSRFDDWLQMEGIPLPSRPAWIAKIDVEGFEGKVLRGMEKALQAQAFIGLVVEFNPYTMAFAGSSRNELLEIFDRSGYGPMPGRDVPDDGNAFMVPRG